jgi:uncharacterized surface protein with fasciclin (FAS1) repeats
MSALYGTDTSYSAIADIHEDLNLTHGQEFEFLTGYSEDPMSDQPMRLWEDWMKWVLFNQVTPSAKEARRALENGIAQQNASAPANNTSNNHGTTIMEVMETDKRLSKFVALIKEVGYGKFWDNGVTIFAPTNDKFDEILEYALKIAYRPVAALQTLRYHLLNYPIKPWQMQDRVLKLTTDLSNQAVESDWTRGKHVLLNKINPGYISPMAGSFTNGGPGADPYPARSDTWFPKHTDEVQVLEAKECNNGWLYVIDRPVVFSDLL